MYGMCFVKMIGKGAFLEIHSFYLVFDLHKGYHVGRHSPEILKTSRTLEFYVQRKAVADLRVGLVLFLHPAFQIIGTLCEQPESILILAQA